MSIAWRAILVAGLAAGEEATLASLTGLFQREPERAAALVASAREGARAINQSRHSEGHETYFRQRRRIEAAVGDYKFYVHTGLTDRFAQVHRLHALPARRRSPFLCLMPVCGNDQCVRFKS